MLLPQAKTYRRWRNAFSSHFYSQAVIEQQHACDGIAEYHLYVARVHFQQIIFTLNRQRRVSFTDDRFPPLNTQFWPPGYFTVPQAVIGCKRRTSG